MIISLHLTSAIVRWLTLLLIAICQPAAIAGTYEIVRQFSMDAAGYYPKALTVDSRGDLYGISQMGGAFGGGTLFKLTSSGISVLHAFGQGHDGYPPFGAPLAGVDGMLYGTTPLGGRRNTGTIYRVDKLGGNYQVLSMHEQAYSVASLIEDGEGNLFGVSQTDIRHGIPSWPGTVFRASFATGEVRTIHRFHGIDGQYPSGRLAWLNGLLIGTTYSDGFENRGVAFSLLPDGSGFSVKRLSNGGEQSAGLTVGRDSRIWGASAVDRAPRAGTGTGNGGLYEIDPQGNARLAVRLTQETGGETMSSLLSASDGMLYNVATTGGDPRCSCGTIYRFDPKTETIEVLHTFTDFNSGGIPQGGLVEASPGVFYGVAAGGPLGLGVLYRFLP